MRLIVGSVVSKLTVGYLPGSLLECIGSTVLFNLVSTMWPSS